MTFTSELIIWLVFCAIGSLTAWLSLRNANRIYAAVLVRSHDPDIIDGWRHLRAGQLKLLLGWVGFFGLGLLAVFDSPPAAPIGVTPTGMVIRYLLIGTVGLWAWMTASDYAYGRQRLQRDGRD